MSESLFGNSAESRVAAAHRARRSGFDCILGNPPWERVKLQEKEWFAERVPEIANAPNAAARGKMIKALATERPELHQRFLDDVRAAEAASAFMRGSGRYPLCGRGDVNLYTVFAESMRDGVSEIGRVGCVVPSGIATDDTTKFFFQDLVDRASLVSLFDFENREGLFEAVDSRMKFACVTLRAPAADEKAAAKATPAEFVFFAHRVEDIVDERRRFTLTRDEIALVNPNTKTCPIFRTKVDAELCKSLHRKWPIWKREVGVDLDPWSIGITRVVDLNLRASELIELPVSGGGVNVSVLRVYEGKMVDMLDHRLADSYTVAVGQRSGRARALPETSLQDPARTVLARFGIARDAVRDFLEVRNAEWTFAYMDVCSVTNERTVIGAVLPQCAPSFSLRAVARVTGSVAAQSCLYGFLSSFALDYYVRQAVGGLHLSDYIMYQVPIIPPFGFDGFVACESLTSIISRRVLELSATADDMSPFSKDLWPEGDGAVFRYDPERRFEIRCELDAAFFHLYLGTPEEWSRTASPELLKSLPTPRDAVAYIMETFPIVKRKDEEAHGHYRTKDRILALYDELQRCLSTGEPFKSTLNPPPGPPSNPDGTFAKLPAWPKGAPKPTNWPAHIHPPQSHRL